MSIKLFNTLTQKNELFTPINPSKVQMYVCGPTVNDRAHIGNARSIVIYDILYRLLATEYGISHVQYVRNITDVDDKINAAAKKNSVPIKELTAKVIGHFNEDMAELNCLTPNIEPKATEHIEDMIKMIEVLIKNGHAYVANKHVYFDVSSDANYGKIAGRNLNEMIAGSRIEVNHDKKSPGDFVLWKPKDEDDDPSSIFQSPWGDGRPGWHIECSAMSTKYFGADFDIHGGGIDLIFPHHTNEIAQSCACHKGSSYARYWVHNGFLTVNGEKMSKSLGNFFTVRDLLDQGMRGETIRYVYLASHYRKPLNWTDKAADDAKKALDSFYRIIENHDVKSAASSIEPRIYAALCEDLNTSEALGIMHDMVKQYNKSSEDSERERIAHNLYAAGKLLGLFYTPSWFNKEAIDVDTEAQINELIALRTQAKQNKDWQQADKIREQLKSMGVAIEDGADGVTSWRRV